jgi:hypothetical protein
VQHGVLIPRLLLLRLLLLLPARLSVSGTPARIDCLARRVRALGRHHCCPGLRFRLVCFAILHPCAPKGWRLLPLLLLLPRVVLMRAETLPAAQAWPAVHQRAQTPAAASGAPAVQRLV